MDIVEKLRELSALEKSFPMSGTCWYEKAADEIERLREDKAELLEALIDMRNHINQRDWDEDVSNEAKATFAKTTGGE